MVTRLALQFHSPFFPIFSANHFIRKELLHNLPVIRSFCTISSIPTISLERECHYGPSLHKGRIPSESQHQNKFPSMFLNEIGANEEAEEEEVEPVLNKESFCRVFDVAALRVPAEECFALESQLRGHLLNWPRVRNIARVPGDEMEDEFKKILPGRNSEEDENYDSLQRRIHGKADSDGETLSPVLYREKLVKSFNTRGYVNFRNLAKISRPKRNKKSALEGDEIQKKTKNGKNDVWMIEIIGNKNLEENDMVGLLGDEFKGGKWRGSTRLLLLDEQYANKDVFELPEAIKALFDGDFKPSKTCELVKCRLTLFYNYWQMNEILEAVLPNSMIVPTSFEMVGHIAHLNLRDEHLPYKKIIAQVVLDKNKPKIQSVVNKIDSIQNDYRTMQLEVLAGNHSLTTVVVENGFRFHVDLATVYWNSRLATERQRLVKGFTSDDVVCDVFSGVGPLAINAASKVKHVYANDLNPSAVEYLERNCIYNKLERKITVYNMDGRRFIDAMFTSQNARPVTQVVMNLPKDAAEFLGTASISNATYWMARKLLAEMGKELDELLERDAFRGIFREKPRSIMPVIHVYGFSKAQDPEFDFHQRIRSALLEFAVAVKMHRVRVVAPGKWMLCASFTLPETVAFGGK